MNLYKTVVLLVGDTACMCVDLIIYIYIYTNFSIYEYVYTVKKYVHVHGLSPLFCHTHTQCEHLRITNKIKKYFSIMKNIA